MIVTLVLITGRSAREPERADGIEPILRVIGGLPPGAPAGFEAAFGWGGWWSYWRITASNRTWRTRCSARRSPRPG